MIREAHYQQKLRFRARGHRELDQLVGGVLAEIDQRLARQDVVHVLELGCGYGTALLELRARYGARVVLHGMNRRAADGDRDILLRNALDRGLLAPGPVAEDWLPAMTFADVAHGLPFADCTFDIVYSQVAWMYFGRKIAVLQEIIRVLRCDGIAKIDADELRPQLPPEYGRLVEIWDDGRLLPFGEYLRGFGLELARAPEGEYVRLLKCAGFGADLEQLFEIDVSMLHRHWDGIKCVYRRQARA